NSSDGSGKGGPLRRRPTRSLFGETENERAKASGGNQEACPPSSTRSVRRSGPHEQKSRGKTADLVAIMPGRHGRSSPLRTGASAERLPSIAELSIPPFTHR